MSNLTRGGVLLRILAVSVVLLALTLVILVVPPIVNGATTTTKQSCVVINQATGASVPFANVPWASAYIPLHVQLANGTVLILDLPTNNLGLVC